MPKRIVPYLLLIAGVAMAISSCHKQHLLGASPRGAPNSAPALVKDFVGHYQFTCLTNGQTANHLLDIKPDGSSMLDGSGFIDRNNPGTLTLNGQDDFLLLNISSNRRSAEIRIQGDGKAPSLNLTLDNKTPSSCTLRANPPLTISKPQPIFAVFSRSETLFCGNTEPGLKDIHYTQAERVELTSRGDLSFTTEDQKNDSASVANNEKLIHGFTIEDSSSFNSVASGSPAYTVKVYTMRPMDGWGPADRSVELDENGVTIGGGGGYGELSYVCKPHSSS